MPWRRFIQHYQISSPMPGNTFGQLFRLTTFGESHGPATGGIIDGCPAGLALDFDFIQHELERRRPVYPGATTRREPDQIEWLSGLYDGTTLGTPIGFLIKNQSADSSDYEQLRDVFRPSHGDYTYQVKFGIRDHRGGGRASGRETAGRVVGGAVARLLLKRQGIDIRGVITRLGQQRHPYPISPGDVTRACESLIRWPDPVTERDVISALQKIQDEGDTIGGEISCLITGVPAGWGEPVFDKLQADLAKAMMSIGTAKGFEYGLGFESPSLPGSRYNDPFTVEDGRISTVTNHDGGIQGGISNGENIYFRVAFKPVPSHRLPQETVDSHGNSVKISLKGRHDSCHVPRLVVVVESMAALVLADHSLRQPGARVR